MADYKIIQKLDEKLIAEGTIDISFKEDYRKVHLKLNSHLKKSGAVLPEVIFKRGDANLRKWLGELYKKGASQEKLTSYLRCGLAHLSFDFIESSYKSIDKEDLVTRALLSFKNREFHKTYFKATDTAIAVKRKRPVKKKVLKKTKKKSINVKQKKKKKAVKKSLSKTVKNKKNETKKVLKKNNLNKKKQNKKKRMLKVKLI